MLRLAMLVPLAALLLLVGCSCSRPSADQPAAASQLAAQPGTAPSAQETPGRQQGLGQPGSAGPQNLVSRRGFGRAAGREWGGTILRLTPDEEKAIGIKTAALTHQPLRVQLRAMGAVTVPQTRKAIVSYAFPARIASVSANIGAWVTRGQTLVTLQSQEVGNAKAEYHKAKADYELAQRNYEREKRLFDRGAGAQKNYFAAETELKVAEANLNAADKKLHVLGFSEEEVQIIARTHQIDAIITLYAPMTGKIVETHAVLGAIVDQSSEILTIVDPRVLWVDAEVYERDIARIRIGQEASVTVPAYPGETFAGTVNYISDLVKPETRTIAVRTEVQNPQQRLKSGMFADVTFFLGDRTNALALPEIAILDNQDEHLVFVRSNDGYIPQVVEVGTKENGYCEILRGLKEGDLVVVNGQFQLKSKLLEGLLKAAHVQ
jgi:cobalt-zinc-cadmium efflux system membrane fusion protein